MNTAGELAQRLAQKAEAVCRTYLFNGHRTGGYWVVVTHRTIPATVYSCAFRVQIVAKGRRGNGPMPLPAIMVIYSIGLARTGAWITCAMSWRRRAPF